MSVEETNEYRVLIEKIVDLKNEMLEVESNLKHYLNTEDRVREEAYLQYGNNLINEIYQKLEDMGYTRQQIDMDVAYT